MDIITKAVGWVECAEGLAAEPKEDFWGEVVSEIRLDEGQFTSDALQGLGEFSHVEILYYLHGVSEGAIVEGVRHPRGNPNWPLVGIFAQRNKARPNRIAATVCELVAVDGLRIRVKGLDALDGSPVVDIKPVYKEFIPSDASVFRGGKTIAVVVRGSGRSAVCAWCVQSPAS